MCPGTRCVPPGGPTTKWTSAIVSLLNMTEFLRGVVKKLWANGSFYLVSIVQLHGFPKSSSGKLIKKKIKKIWSYKSPKMTVWAAQPWPSPLLSTDLSRIVGNKPCQLLPPLLAALTWLLLLTAALCCWSCWMEELVELLLLLAEWEGSGFLVGKSSAAILFLSVGRWWSAQVKLKSRHIRLTGTGEDPKSPDSKQHKVGSIWGSCHVKDVPVQVTH